MNVGAAGQASLILVYFSYQTNPQTLPTFKVLQVQLTTKEAVNYIDLIIYTYNTKSLKKKQKKKQYGLE